MWNASRFIPPRKAALTEGVGVFAMVFMALNPQIPVIEEGG